LPELVLDTGGDIAIPLIVPPVVAARPENISFTQAAPGTLREEADVSLTLKEFLVYPDTGTGDHTKIVT
jgi:hypothetical protein